MIECLPSGKSHSSWIRPVPMADLYRFALRAKVIENLSISLSAMQMPSGVQLLVEMRVHRVADGRSASVALARDGLAPKSVRKAMKRTVGIVTM